MNGQPRETRLFLLEKQDEAIDRLRGMLMPIAAHYDVPNVLAAIIWHFVKPWRPTEDEIDDINAQW